ncbi:MAG TPA: nuclear transport factor 2 family protein [Rhizomicrobium sp.]|nr:nuclear transport factor 2 family protein [Rhizomicrobium sp.]
MPDKQVLDDFIAMVLSGRHDQAIADFYAEDCTMQENLGEIRRGRDAAVAREKMTLSLFKEVRTTLVPPLFVAGDHVVLHWIFEFVRADGSVMRIEELAQQRWVGNKMAEERFYYDPAQMAGMRG